MARNARFLLLRATLAGLAIWLAAPAHAATIAVTSTADDFGDGPNGNCTLREAILAANGDTPVDACTAGGGADEVVLAAGTYTLTILAVHSGPEEGDLDVLDSLTISGAGAGSTVIEGSFDPQRGLGTGRVFEIHSGSAFAIRGVTIQKGAVYGDDGGGIYLRAGSLVLEDAVLRDNSASWGGGLAIAPGASARVERTAVVGNQASGYCVGTNCAIFGGAFGEGGGIRNRGTLEVVNSTVAANSADASGNGPGFGAGIANDSDLTVRTSTIAGNTAEAFGASGIAANATAVVTRLAGSILGDACAGPSFVSDGGNLEAGATCGLGHPDDLPGTDPRLGPTLILSGGSYVRPLFLDSPAIDSLVAGCPTLDQRGVGRPVDGDGSGGAECDRGALEQAAGPDGDGDGLIDSLDLCPGEPDPDQADTDRDGIGDACDACIDVDGDGYGNPASLGCAHPEPDCLDSNAGANPGADEVMGNGIDDDCDPGTIDCGPDGDGDGFSPTGGVCGARDCDDVDPAVNPDADEIPFNGKDDDCSPHSPDCTDQDGDGWAAEEFCAIAPDEDCDDTDPGVNPGQVEIPGNGKDDDCNATTPGACVGPQVAEAGGVAGERRGQRGGGADLALMSLLAFATVRGLRRRSRRSRPGPSAN